MAWERMPAETHISAIFDMGDRCTEDIGEAGPDTDTGLGRLDIGCIADAVYKANLHPAAAILSVAAKVPAPPKATVALVAGKKPKDHYVLDDPESIPEAFSRLGVTVSVGRGEDSYAILGALNSFGKCIVHVQVFDDGGSTTGCLMPHKLTDLLNEMGLSYTKLNGNYQEAYKTTPENSIVYFQDNPLFLHGSNARNVFLIDHDANGEDGSYFDSEVERARHIAIDPESIEEHGWIVSRAAYVSAVSWKQTRYMDDHPHLHDKFTEHLEEGYRKAIETGKVRLFYALSVDEEGRVRDFLNNWGSNGCKGFENYCIGVPYRYNIAGYKVDVRKDGLDYARGQLPEYLNGVYNWAKAYYHSAALNFEATYGFGVYLAAWERMPADTHISAIFAMGDRCAQDIGKKGPDAETGLGYLDVGCMAREVYQANLNPAAATLSVAFVQVPVSSGQSMLTDSAGSLQAQSVSPAVDSQQDVPARQQFFDDFAQELFSDLGSLRLPGETDAGLMMGFPGDSFQGRYRPARGVQPHYHVSLPEPRYALAGGGIGVMGIGAGEIGIFARMEGLDLSFSYSRSEDFFGGAGSGQFEFEEVGNTRLMLQKRLLPEGGDHSLMLGGWLKHAAVTGGKGALLGDLQGSEYGASMRYDWQGGDRMSVAATVWAARFAGGDVELAGNRFSIAASDWKWGIGVVGTYEF